MIGRNIFFIVIMFVFLNLWKAIYSTGDKPMIDGFTLNTMIWYLVFSEMVVLSRSSFYGTMNDDVKTGSIAYLLNKPYNYILYGFSYSMGETIVKLLCNAVIGIGIGLLFVGPLETFSIVSLPFVIFSILAGAVLNFIIYMCLALSSFWFEENSSFFWIYSKLVFILGGMLVPIDIFPNWLQSICRYLPFAYVTYAPAKLAVSFSMESFISLFSMQLIYIGVFILLSMVLYRTGARDLNVNGG